MDPDGRVLSPAHSNGRPGSQAGTTSPGHDSAASRTGSGGSARSNHSNLSGIALRTGRGKNGQEDERASTPTAVLPPIGRVSPDDIHQSTKSADSGEQYYSSSPDLRPNNGESMPRITRGFKRETSPTDQSTCATTSLPATMDKPVGKRVVSFVAQERKTPERREVTLQSFETQTDWDWLEDAMLDESVKILEPRLKQECAESVVQSTTETEPEEEEIQDEEGPLPYPYSNDEFGVPILDLSSDSEMSSDDEAEKPKPNDKLLPSVGPPQILQYNRESEQKTPVVAEPQIEESTEPSADYPQDDSGKVHGYFSGVCEFCGSEIRPFPTLEQQQQQLPEELYCCEAYRNFIETVLNEEKAPPTQAVIDVKPHAHYGSKKERKVAQQKAQLRMRERQLLRQQQQSVQSSSQQSSHYHTVQHQYGKQSKHSSLDHHERSPGYTLGTPVARQMKTINYQLSSQRCLEEGWTVRPPSPMLQEEVEDIFIPEPLDPAFAALNKNRKRELIQKFYDDGSPYLTIFPDGSGNIFYHSGNVAIVVSCPEAGQYTFMVLEDDPGPPELGEMQKMPKCVAVFGSNGHASCCYDNGKLRLFMDEFMGIELDRVGAKKRKWFWNDTETHVHAPPFQPVCFALTPHIAVRVMSQENMTLTFRCKNRSCRLPVGARLKLVNPENLPAKEVDSDYLFISEKKALTQTILNRISNLLHFPKSPKVEKMLPPLHITSRVHKNEVMQHQRDAALAAAKAKKTNQRPIRPVVVS